MKITTRVTQEIEMPMPLHGDEVTMQELRLLHRKQLADLKDQLTKDGWDVEVYVNMTLFCDANQRQRVAFFPGFVLAKDFAQVKATRLDFGAWENFRFKWSHE